MIQAGSILETKKFYTWVKKLIGQVGLIRVSADCKTQILSTTKMIVLITIISRGDIARLIAEIARLNKKSSQICKLRKIPPSSKDYHRNPFRHCKAT